MKPTSQVYEQHNNNKSGETENVVSLKNVYGHLLSAFSFCKKEIEISRAVGELSRLDDETLEDIGVNRDEIEQIVRHGRKAA